MADLENMKIENIGIQQENISLTEESAIVLGKTLTELPEDLYIPPHALRVFLETFTGPLDLLLYLIRKQNIDVLDIPVAKITTQYIEYLELMHELRLELAAEYLVMAAILAEIKSKLLLPKLNIEEQVEEDPRAELVRRLQEYERYKIAAEKLDALPRLERDVFRLSIEAPAIDMNTERLLPKLELQNLAWVFKEVLERAAMYHHHKIKLESLSVRERMTNILDKLHHKKTLKFADFFCTNEGKIGVVVTFMAILELLRQEVIAITQIAPFADIYLQSTTK